MLGIRLDADAEALLAKHAKALGRPKSAIARDWIIERLERESLSRKMRYAAEALRQHYIQADYDELDQAADAWLQMLDEADGGYDWGPNGPPQ
jgi:Na+-transporting NADH:ubiquinone oxidoreductase subunit NqrF